MNEKEAEQLANPDLQYEQNRILNQKLIEQYLYKFYNDYLKDFNCNLTFCEFTALFAIAHDYDLIVTLKSLVYQYVQSGKYDQTKFKQILHYIQNNNNNDSSDSYLKGKNYISTMYKQLLCEQEKKMYDMSGKNQKYYYPINGLEFTVKKLTNNSNTFQSNVRLQKSVNWQKDFGNFSNKDNQLSQGGKQLHNSKEATLGELRKHYTDQHAQFERQQFSIKSQVNHITNYLQEIKQYKQDGPFKSQFFYHLFNVYQRLRAKDQNKDVHHSNQASLVFLITFIEEFKVRSEFEIIQLLSYQNEISISNFVNNICFNQSQKIQNINQFRSTAIYSIYIYDINMHIEFSDKFQLHDIMESDWQLLFENYQHCNFLITSNKDIILFREVDTGNLIVSHSAEEAFQKINYRFLYDVIIVSTEHVYGIQQIRMRSLRYSNTGEKVLRLQLRHTNELLWVYLSGVKCLNMNKFVNLRSLGSIKNEYNQMDFTGMRNLKVFCSKDDIYLQQSKSLLEVLFQKTQLVCVAIQRGNNVARDAVLHTGFRDLRVFYIDHQLNLVMDQSMCEAEQQKIVFMYDEADDKFKIPTFISKRIKLKPEQDLQLLSC